MHTLYFILLAVGALCFLIAAAGHATVAAGRRPIALVPLGLLAWILVPLIEQARIAFRH